MGIHYWSKSAVLILALATFQTAHSATQVSTPTSTFTNIMNAAQSAIGLPYGDAAFFGPEFTAQHTAGSRFSAGQSLPSSGTPGKVQVAIKPVVTINAAKVGKSIAGAIKGGGVPGIMGQAAVMWAINQIPGAEIVNNQPVIITTGDPVAPSTPTDYGWKPSYNRIIESKYASPDLACKSLSAAINAQYNSYMRAVYKNARRENDGYFSCFYQEQVRASFQDPWVDYNDPTNFLGWQIGAARDGAQCPTGTTYDQATGTCRGAASTVPFNDQNYSDLEEAIASVKNSDWLRDLTKAKCQGALSPEACYQDLVDRRPNHGPSSQTTPPVSTTATKTNPDGTTTTTTTTVQNKYDYTYTQNNFTYRTTTTTTTTTDGKTTTEVVSDTTDPNTPPFKEPQSEDSDEPIEFTDSEFPQVTPFYEQKYPGGLSGVWNEVSADIGNSAFIGFLKSFVPTFSGSCPAFGLSFNIASWANYGAVSFWNMCWIFDFIKIIMLVTAVFTARALTFGG